MKLLHDNLPLVSVVIPCRNEEGRICKCLDSINANDYPKDKLEILVVDGESEDGTLDVVKEMAKEHSNIRSLTNPKRTTPAGLNVGIRHARGEIIMIMGAHGACAPNYVSRCVNCLLHTDKDAVGGLYATLPGSDTYAGNAIAWALSSPFGVGNAYYRIGISGDKDVDTVAWGCYRKEVFDRCGLFDEEFVSCEDDEFNYRLRKTGASFLLTSETTSYYYARTSLRRLWHQYVRYGTWKVRVFQKHPGMMQLRQFVPGIFVLGLAGGLVTSILHPIFLFAFVITGAFYLCLSLLFSLKIAVQHGRKYVGIMPLVFLLIHVGYGLGFLIGLVKFAGRWGRRNSGADRVDLQTGM
jgi:glycosyltransferase involved in cell wall biosynthesis